MYLQPVRKVDYMTGIIVRPISEDDFYTVSLFEKGDAGHLHQAAVFVRQSMILWPESFLVAEMGGNIVGYLICTMMVSDPGCGWVLRVRVSEAMRRKGIGTAMLERAHEIMQKAGVIQVLLSCSPGNEGAFALYERQGYWVIRHEIGYFGEGEDRLILRKDLV